MKWIELKNVLPQYEQNVLLLCKVFTEKTTNSGFSDPFIRTGYRDSTNKRGENFKIHGDDRIFHTNSELLMVTHWMPLPSLPKIKSKPILSHGNERSI